MSGSRRVLLLLFSVVAGFLASGMGARAEGLTPAQEATRELFVLVLIPAIAIGVLVMVLLAYAVAKFRIRKGRQHGPLHPKTHDRTLEAVWTVIPAVILLIVGAATFQALRVTDTIPEEPDVIVYVWAGQWYWSFNVTYPNGTSRENTTGSFTLQTGEVAKLVIQSVDVAHSLYIPAFDFKIDAIPGRENIGWLQVLRPGEYVIRCAEFCGSPHYAMSAVLLVTA